MMKRIGLCVMGLSVVTLLTVVPCRAAERVIAGDRAIATDRTIGVETAVSDTIQTPDDDIWREVDLGELDYKKAKNYCVRLYGYYRYIDDGIDEFYVGNDAREQKLYKVYEGLCELDVRYDRSEDEGAFIHVGRDLVHPEKPGKIMDFYELTPYTFIEKARRKPKVYTIQKDGDSTFVYTKNKRIGFAVRDEARQELLMDYNALAPDTALSFNLLIASARLSNVYAKAVYQLDDTGVEYVPQGNLKNIVFEGDIVLSMFGGKAKSDFHEHTEIYVDSVVYMTRDEYKADRKIKKEQRRQQLGYTMADIDRMKMKHNVPPLSDAVLKRIEEQRDWDEQYELWKKVEKEK